MFIMTHSQFGYYIHGRSPHGNADSSMQQMAQALLKEQNGMTTKRGLEEGSDHQTFSISITNKLSKQYSKVMYPLYEVI
jgi:meckelin